MQEIIIKNMVCPRCVEAVRQVFIDLKVPTLHIKLGSVMIAEKLSAPKKKTLEERLLEKGFEFLDDKQTKLINAIKSFIVQKIHHETTLSPVNFSTRLAQQLHYDYAYLSRLFSSVEGRTIEQFVMAQKIERVKELITYKEWTLGEIAFEMNYSSAAHLSAQFKKVTGMSPSHFKKLKNKDRQFLDNV